MFMKLKNQTVISAYNHDDLPLEDPDLLVEQLDVINLAKQQARKNLPSSASGLPDANELHFRQKIESKAMQVTNSVQTSVSALKNEIQSLSISQATSATEQIPKEFDQQITAELAPRLRELETLKKKYETALDDLNNFRKTHGIRREPHYPPSNWMTVSILLLALIAESILNGHFFAAGVDTGLIGGVFQASIIALINIGFGFLLGWWLLPYKNHSNRRLAHSLLALFLVFLFFPLIFNLLVGHYREALINSPDNAHQIAIASFTNGIFSITDFNSWALCALGLLFCILAIYKGYTFDDPYPGYGKLARRADELEDSIDEERENVISDLETLHMERLEQLEECYLSVEYTEKKLNSLSSEFKRQNSLLERYISHLEGVLGYIIRLYRDTNASEREVPPPNDYTQDYDTSLGVDALNIGYRDKADEIAEGREKISNLLPIIRAQMLDSKVKYHQKINELCQP